jgi:hypothetical protein
MSQSIDTVAGDQSIRIHAPCIEDRGEWTRVSYRVDGADEPELWFDVDGGHREFVTSSCDAAVVALLIAAMAAGKPIRSEGPLSRRLRWSIHNTVVPVVCRLLPFLRPIQVLADGGWEVREPEGSAVLTGFSCGVDSLSAIQDHLLYADIAESERVTHLLFSHVGHHGYGKGVHRRAEERWHRARRAAGELGIPIGRVYSNTPEFYPPEYDSRLNWIGTLTVRGSAVPLLLQAGVRRFLQASSHTWEKARVCPTWDMTYAESILLPALSTERVELGLVGAEYTRVEKTRRIADLDLAQRYLDVCIMEGGEVNCSRCEKCLRTMLTLEILGYLDRFDNRFDLDTYRHHRAEFLARVLTERNDSLHLEIQYLIRESGFSLPVSGRFRAALLQGWRLIPHELRRRLRGMPAATKRP